MPTMACSGRRKAHLEGRDMLLRGDPEIVRGLFHRGRTNNWTSSAASQFNPNAQEHRPGHVKGEEDGINEGNKQQTKSQEGKRIKKK